MNKRIIILGISAMFPEAPTDTTIMKQKRSMTTMTMKMKPDMTTKRNFSDTKPTCMPGMTMQPEKPDIRTK